MKTPISPKVTTGGIWAGYATLLLALLNTVTPDSLAFLGHLAPLGYGVVIGGSYALGAFLKADPLRVATKPGPDGSYNITGLPAATAPDPANALAEFSAVLHNAPTITPTSFASTQGRLDAAAAEVPTAPVSVTPVYEPPATPAAE